MYDSGSTADSSYAGSYEIFKAEGDVLFKQGNPKKALNSYNKALDLKPGDRTCLVARSQCYLQLGDSEAALIDAEATLQDEPENTKGLLQKAEALYCKGDFEYALVFYHRGNKLRPEVQAFRLGIQKSQEAIENCIGNNASIQLENKGDLSYFYKQDEKAPKKEERRGYKQAVVKKEERPIRRPHSHKDKKTIKQLLGELYADRNYLEQLLEETEGASNQSETNMTIRDLAIQGLEYLDTRTDFWQQQKPMYSRKRDGDMRNSRSRAGTAGGDPTAYVLKALEEIDEAQAQSKFEDSLKLAKKAMKTIDRWTEKDLPNRPEFVANIHSAMGNAYLEMSEYAKALEHHNVDREIATQQDIEECKSRALDNLGRVYARMGKFDKALEFWEEKLPMSKSALERTWLYHEIGRCYLEQGKFQTARDNGEKSLAEAEEAGDDVWQLNASVLVAQAQMKLGDYQAALDYFERSLDMAKVQNDKMAEKAIKHAIEDANRKIVKSIKSASSQDRDSRSAKSDKNSEKENKPKRLEPQEKEKAKKKNQDARSMDGETNSAKTRAQKPDSVSQKSETRSTASETKSQKSDTASKKSEAPSKKSDTKSKKSDTPSKKSESQSQKSEAKSKKSDTASKKGDTLSKKSDTGSKKGDGQSLKSETGSEKSKKGRKGSKASVGSEGRTKKTKKDSQLQEKDEQSPAEEGDDEEETNVPVRDDEKKDTKPEDEEPSQKTDDEKKDGQEKSNDD